nr:ADP-ribosylglycohydrolase family protein [Acaryochloris sp. CCMEE 5410]
MVNLLPEKTPRHHPCSKVLSGLMGLCIGDALGVPVEFLSREELMESPVTDLDSRNEWREPPGTWSDDSSLTFCLADSLCDGFSLQAITNSFCRWYYEQEWTARGKVFDIGITTQMAIEKLRNGVSPLEAGDTAGLFYVPPRKNRMVLLTNSRETDEPSNRYFEASPGFPQCPWPYSSVMAAVAIDGDGHACWISRVPSVRNLCERLSPAFK